MTPTAYALLGLSALVGVLAGLLAFAILRVVVGMRDVARRSRGDSAASNLMLPAIEEAVARMRAEERATSLRADASERLSDQIVTSLTAGLLVVDLDRRVRILNPAGQRLLGVSAVGGLGPLPDVLSWAPELAEVIVESLTAARPVDRRVVLLPGVRPSPTHLGVSVSPLRDGAGGQQGAICLFTDLSDVVVLEAQVRLKDALARLGELTAGLAHEFRNGLATVHGYARLIKLERLPEDYRPYLQGLRAETEALGEVVHNFLAFARPVAMAMSPVDLEAVLRRAVEDVGADAPAGARLEVRGQAGTILGDEVLLRQAVANIVRNAVEACREAGVVPHVVLEGRRDEPRSQAVIEVGDNGPGFDPAILPRLFQPFASGRPGGTGLGLALVQKIVLGHNGQVSAERAAGGGALVRLQFPLPAAAHD